MTQRKKSGTKRDFMRREVLYIDLAWVIPALAAVTLIGVDVADGQQRSAPFGLWAVVMTIVAGTAWLYACMVKWRDGDPPPNHDADQVIDQVNSIWRRQDKDR